MAKAKTPTGVQLEMVALGAIPPWPRNPKRHDLESLKASLRRFGFVNPLILDATTGQLVAGHGRLEALMTLREAGESAPERIEVDASGEWSVPLVRVPFSSVQEAEGYLLADNRQSELGGWDETMLNEILSELREADALDGTGWRPEEVASILATAETNPDDFLPDPKDTAVPKPPSQTKNITIPVPAVDHADIIARFQGYAEENDLSLGDAFVNLLSEAGV